MCISIVVGLDVSMEQNGQPYLCGPNFIGLFVSLPDSELEHSDCDLAVLCKDFIFSASLRGNFLPLDLRGLLRDRTLVTTNGSSSEYSWFNSVLTLGLELLSQVKLLFLRSCEVEELKIDMRPG